MKVNTTKLPVTSTHGTYESQHNEQLPVTSTHGTYESPRHMTFAILI
jgi:hypothetical protein